MKEKKIRNNDIIENTISTGEYLLTPEETEKVILKGYGTPAQKLASYIFFLCDSDKDLYGKTIELLTLIDNFKTKLE